MPTEPIESDRTAKVFDVNGAITSAAERTLAIDEQIKTLQNRRAKDQATINVLREERKTLARFVSAGRPRSRRSTSAT